MQAMTVKVKGRYAVLLGYESKYYARLAYILAHELGHIILGHLENSESLLDMDDPLTAEDLDSEEVEAGRAAFVLLTGRDDPQVQANIPSYRATQVAQAARDAADREGIEPGILALCLGHATGNWQETFGALKMISPGAQPVGDQINELAANQFDWSALSHANRDYLAQVIGRGDDG
jgi:hypothetical protein